MESDEPVYGFAWFIRYFIACLISNAIGTESHQLSGWVIDWLICRTKFFQVCLFSFTHFDVNSNLCYYWRIVFHSKVSVVNITGLFIQDGVLRTRSAYFFHFFVIRTGAGFKTAKNNWHGKSLGATTRRSHADVLVNELQRRGRQVYSYRDARDFLRCQHTPPRHVEAAHAAC